MTIHINSRYVGSPNLLIDSAHGKQHTLYPETTKSDGSQRYIVYIAKDGDSFDVLASRVYGDPTQYWRIADINPHVFFPGTIPPGTFLRMPVS